MAPHWYCTTAATVSLYYGSHCITVLRQPLYHCTTAATVSLYYGSHGITVLRQPMYHCTTAATVSLYYGSHCITAVVGMRRIRISVKVQYLEVEMNGEKRRTFVHGEGGRGGEGKAGGGKGGGNEEPEKRAKAFPVRSLNTLLHSLSSG
jgi:hypothetical protein